MGNLSAGIQAWLGELWFHKVLLLLAQAVPLPLPYTRVSWNPGQGAEGLAQGRVCFQFPNMQALGAISTLQ